MAVNVTLTSTGSHFTVSPTLPRTITNTSNLLITITADTNWYFEKPSDIYDWFDVTGSTDGVSITFSQWTPSTSDKPTKLEVRIAVKSSNQTGTVVLTPVTATDGVNISVVKDLTNTTTNQTFDNITSQGQYTIQTRPATDYFILDGDTENNYQTISDPNVGTLGNVTFNKTGTTVNYAEFTYTAPSSGIATWTIHSKAYPSNGVYFSWYNDHTFTTNVSRDARYINETVHVVISAVSGYYFQNTPTYNYNNYSTQYPFTKTSDYEYYADIPVTDKTDYTCVNLYAEGVTDAKSYFSYSLNNCTISENPEYIRYSKIFIVSPNEGYVFESAPVVTGANQVQITHLIDGTYRISYTFNANENVTISATAVESASTYHLTYNTTNVSTDVPAQEIEVSDTLIITLTANQTGESNLTQYLFDSTPYYTVDGVNTNFTRVSDTVYTANIVVTDNIAVYASATVKASKITFHLQSCTGTPNYWLESNSEVTVTVTANTGYIFENTNPPQYTYDTADRYVMTKISDTEYQVVLPTDSIYSEYLHENANIYATAVQYVEPDTDTTISHGFINVYKPTQEQLASLTRYRFVQQSSGTERDDMGQYIYKLHKVFFHIPTTRTATVQFAYHSTSVVVPAVDSEIITANCGTVAVTEQYNNSFDYEGFTTARMYLPFIGFRDIDINNIMNDSVTLKYKLNVLNADCVAILSTANRNEIYTFEGVAGFDIPYMLNNYNNSINGNFAQNNVYMAGFTPYLQLFTKKPYLAENSPYGYKTNEWKRLSTINGYAEFQDVNLNLIHKNITQSELHKIKDLLLGGVFL